MRMQYMPNIAYSISTNSSEWNIRCELVCIIDVESMWTQHMLCVYLSQIYENANMLYAYLVWNLWGDYLFMCAYVGGELYIFLWTLLVCIFSNIWECDMLCMSVGISRFSIIDLLMPHSSSLIYLCIDDLKQMVY